MHKISLTIISLISTLYSAQSIATVLTFDISGASNTISSIPQNYGDNVSATTMGTFSYGSSGGFTPNVTVSNQGDSGASLAFWSTGYNDLINVAENETDGASGFSFTFTAEAGYKVILNSFDIGNWGSAIDVPEVSIFDESNSILFQRSSIPLFQNTIQSHVSLDFDNIIGQSLTISISTLGLGGNSDNVGLDNIQFSQTSAVPVPGAIWLFGSAFFGLIRFKQLTKV